MNINSIKQNTGYLHSKAVNRMCRKDTECLKKERYNNTENKTDRINTTIKSNSDGRASFKGGTPFLHSAANFASHNPLVAEAMFAIAVTGILRPLTIMATAHNEEDKSKCTYQAVKSISSGLVGLGTTALIGTPISAATKKAKESGAFEMPENLKEQSLNAVKKGVDILKEKAQELPEIAGVNIQALTEGGKINLGVFKETGKNAERTFKTEVSKTIPEHADVVIKAIKEQHTLNNYKNAAKNVADKLFQPIFMPIRANITIALVPIILGALGLKKASSMKKEQVNNPYKNMNLNIIQNNNKEIFKTFTGVTRNENK